MIRYRASLPLFVALLFHTACSLAQENASSQSTTDSLLAFPGAEGFGRYATGGRGGAVIYVTNLNDSGPGSLREAIDNEEARYILFKTSGTIALKSPLRIESGDVTIAGQTAPGDGICIKGYSTYIDADNVIIRFIRFRLGDLEGQEDDALGGRFHKNIMIDHCSMSWSVDECVSFYQNENTTLQWCIIAESLNNSVHHKGPHGYGGIWGGKRASFHHNLLAHHNSRNPRLGERAGVDFALEDLVDLRNNVIYNWGKNSCYGGEAMNVNIVNCYYKPGPASNNKERIIAIDQNLKEGNAVSGVWGRFYINGNYIDGSPRVSNDNWTYGVFNQFSTKYKGITEADKKAMQLEAPLPIGGNVATHTAMVAYEKVLAYAGASLKRDAVDARIVENVRNGNYSFAGSKGSTGGIIDSQVDVGGWPRLQSLPPPVDSSGDGMPDSWKLKNGLQPRLQQANEHTLHSEYDNLEIYLNSLVEAIITKQGE